MDNLKVLFLLIASGFVILWGLIGLVTFRLQKKRSKEVLDKFKEKKILGVSSSANYFGQESKGRGQLRGNGVLVLTTEELYFQMWLPKNELHIPISRITNIDMPRSFLGKTKLRPLLKIIFKNELNETDSAAWLVKGVTEWKNGLEKLIAK